MTTFDDFKNAFSYGERNNLNFKFLAHLNEAEAADFLEELLFLTGEYLNSGKGEKLTAHLVKGQKLAYSKPSKFTYQDGPFTPLTKKTSQARIGLLTSSGHFVAGDDPKPFGLSNMTQEEAIKKINQFLREKPTLSAIPKNTPTDELRVRHGGYDISGAQTDPGTVFPLENLRLMEERGVIGELAPAVHSFVGACAQGALKKEIERVWMPSIRELKLDAMLLIPV
ncbi:MAG: glycine/sarcosine/betaine reductase selenoprotein B family protein [Bacillota bacterium]|nr:glycine/sarcosine/betaine reductase selenoprotein B family protein [Bacillota bacterium]